MPAAGLLDLLLNQNGFVVTFGPDGLQLGVYLNQLVRPAAGSFLLLTLLLGV